MRFIRQQVHSTTEITFYILRLDQFRISINISISRQRGLIRSYTDLVSEQWDRQHSAIAVKIGTGKKPYKLAVNPGMWHHTSQGAWSHSPTTALKDYIQLGGKCAKTANCCGPKRLCLQYTMPHGWLNNSRISARCSLTYWKHRVSLGTCWKS